MATTKGKAKQMRDPQVIDGQRQEILVIAGQLLNGPDDPFEEYGDWIGLDERDEYQKALKAYHEAGATLARLVMETVVQDVAAGQAYP